RATLGERWGQAILRSVGNVLFDYLALLAALVASGARPKASLVLLAYVSAVVLGLIPITPGGLGFVEAGLAATLVLGGVAAAEARELVAESLRRIDALDADLGAVVALGADEALEDADALDAAVADGAEARALAGVPLLVKDMTDVAGMRTTFGSRVFAETPAARSDALVVARLRSAGAIVVGKTNLPEFAVEGYTSNLLFGPTRNPWNRDGRCGASSAGSAVAIAT